MGVTVHEVRETAGQGEANQGRPGPDDSVEWPALLATQVSSRLQVSKVRVPMPYGLVLSEAQLIRPLTGTGGHKLHRVGVTQRVVKSQQVSPTLFLTGGIQ